MFCGQSKWRHPRLAAKRLSALILFMVLAPFFSATIGLCATELVINSMNSDPSAKKAFNALVTAFRQSHPDINVVVNTVDHESYKVQIRTWLPNNAPDIATWFAGNRAAYFVDKGLIEPIDDVWGQVAAQFSPATAAAVSFSGHVYLLPVSYYNWGFFYRRDLFERAGIKVPPATWAELVTTVSRLRSVGLVPITIGTKGGWPAAAWFDFLNLRTQGAPAYLKLLRGESSYLDPQVIKAMDYWRQLIDLKAFPQNAPAMTWQEATALLWQGKAAMYLMGSFLASEIPAAVADKIGFFPFPTIDANVPTAELAPVDVYFVPAKAKHKEAAKRFLAFAATPMAQRLVNIENHQLPPNLDAAMPGADQFQRAGAEVLRHAQALTQFYDRDANPEVAKVGMDAFVEYMAYPERVQDVLAKVERARKRVHKR